MSAFDAYRDRHPHVRFAMHGGVLEMRVHTDEGPWRFSRGSHEDLGLAFEDVALDRDVRVVIFSGTGERFCADFDGASFEGVRDRAAGWESIIANSARLTEAFLRIEVPVISVINGPAITHAHLPVLADVVLAASDATLRDAVHFVRGMPPGDGSHLVWTALLGPNRGRYFLMTGESLSPLEAQRLGVVGEVLPRAGLMPRARALAMEWAKMAPPALRATRRLLNQSWRESVTAGLHQGLMSDAFSTWAALERR